MASSQAMPGLGTTIKVLNKAMKAGLDAASDDKPPARYAAGGFRVRCAHCQGEMFGERLAALGRVVNNFSKSRFLVCVHCTHVMIFGENLRRLKPPSEPSAESGGGSNDAADAHPPSPSSPSTTPDDPPPQN